MQLKIYSPNVLLSVFTLFFGTAFLSRLFGNIMLYTTILNDNKDFLNLYKRGRYISSKYSVIYIRPNGKPYNRLGITAGKKTGNAVCRNRAKRVIRVAYRRFEIDLPLGIDIVIVARSLLASVSSEEFCGYMQKYGVPDIVKAAGAFSKKNK